MGHRRRRSLLANRHAVDWTTLQEDESFHRAKRPGKNVRQKNGLVPCRFPDHVLDRYRSSRNRCHGHSHLHPLQRQRHQLRHLPFHHPGICTDPMLRILRRHAADGLVKLYQRSGHDCFLLCGSGHHRHQLPVQDRWLENGHGCL